jgi:hypothetical protein
MLYYNNMSCTCRHIQLLSTPNHVPGISACGTCLSGAFFIRAIPGAPPSDQRFALLKIAPGNFFITREGWYSESGLSPRQSVGVVPDERRELCEWPNNAGTRYPELVGDTLHKSTAFGNSVVVTNSTAPQFSATNLHARPHS